MKLNVTIVVILDIFWMHITIASSSNNLICWQGAGLPASKNTSRALENAGLRDYRLVYCSDAAVLRAVTDLSAELGARQATHTRNMAMGENLKYIYINPTP